MVIGGCGLQIWGLETCERMFLGLMTITIESQEAETAQGVRVSCKGVAQIRLKSLKESQGAGGAAVAGDFVHDFESIQLALTHFGGETDDSIRDSIRITLEGHQRQILGTLTVEQLFKDRETFNERVREFVHDDLNGMGYELVSYTIANIEDAEGYLESLGQTQTEVVKRQAAEGESRNEAEARKKVAQFDADAEMSTAESQRVAHVAVNQGKQAQAESDRDLSMLQQSFTKQVGSAQAAAKAAGEIEAERQQQQVVKEKMQQYTFSSVFSIVTRHSTCTRALTCENVCQGALWKRRFNSGSQTFRSPSSRGSPRAHPWLSSWRRETPPRSYASARPQAHILKSFEKIVF